MPRIVRWALPVLMLAGAAGCKDDPVGPGDMRMLIAPEALALYVGEQAPVAAQVVRGDGRVVDFATVLYWSEHPSVANVTGTGVVSGVTPGTTHVVAAYGTVQARLAVTVAPDDRAALHQLEFAVAEIGASTRDPEPVSVGFTARDGFGNSICDQVELAFRSDTTVAKASNGSTGPGECRVLVRPYGWGQTYVVASSSGVSDSVLVRVTSTEYRVYFSDAPADTAWRVGSVARFVARVEDEGGAPLAGRTVAFHVSGGTLDADRVVTDSDGNAAVAWTLPRRLRYGPRHTLELRTRFPDGRAGTASLTLDVLPGPPATLQFYRESFNNWTLLSGTPRFPLGGYITILTLGRDAYGNLSELPAPRFSMSTASGVLYTSSGCDYTSFSPDKDLPDYRYCWGKVIGYASRPGTFRLVAQVPGLLQDHLDFVVD